MADENKKVNGTENLETANQEQNVENNAPAEETKSDDKKTTITVPKWLVKLGRGIEAVAAIFGGIVGVVLVKDMVTSRKKKNYIDAPVYPQVTTKPVTPMDEGLKSIIEEEPEI